MAPKSRKECRAALRSMLRAIPCNDEEILVLSDADGVVFDNLIAAVMTPTMKHEEKVVEKRSLEQENNDMPQGNLNSEQKDECSSCYVIVLEGKEDPEKPLVCAGQPKYAIFRESELLNSLKLFADVLNHDKEPDDEYNMYNIELYEKGKICVIPSAIVPSLCANQKAIYIHELLDSMWVSFQPGWKYVSVTDPREFMDCLCWWLRYVTTGKRPPTSDLIVQVMNVAKFLGADDKKLKRMSKFVEPSGNVEQITENSAATVINPGGEAGETTQSVVVESSTENEESGQITQSAAAQSDPEREKGAQSVEHPVTAEELPSTSDVLEIETPLETISTAETFKNNVSSSLSHEQESSTTVNENPRIISGSEHTPTRTTLAWCATNDIVFLNNQEDPEVDLEVTKIKSDGALKFFRFDKRTVFDAFPVIQMVYQRKAKNMFHDPKIEVIYDPLTSRPTKKSYPCIGIYTEAFMSSEWAGQQPNYGRVTRVPHRIFKAFKNLGFWVSGFQSHRLFPSEKNDMYDLAVFLGYRNASVGMFDRSPDFGPAGGRGNDKRKFNGDSESGDAKRQRPYMGSRGGRRRFA